MTPQHVFLFPGQGAQALGMAVDLVENCPEARAVFDRGRDVLDFDILSICREGPEEALNSTRVSQPAIFLHSMAILEVLGRRRPIAAEWTEGSFGATFPAFATAGLSLGEYSALVFARSLSFEEALELVALRGRYMQEACDAERGSMASVLGLAAGCVEEVVAEARGEGLRVGIANYNSPSQTVISGAEADVEETGKRLTKAGARRVVMLRVAGAYHSPLMAAATQKMEAPLRKAGISPPRIPFYANYSGAEVRDPEEIRRGLLSQIENPVRWDQSIRAMLEKRDGAPPGKGAFLELGPGRVLQGLMRNIDRSAQVHSIGDLQSLDKPEVLPL